MSSRQAETSRGDLKEFRVSGSVHCAVSVSDDRDQSQQHFHVSRRVLYL